MCASILGSQMLVNGTVWTGRVDQHLEKKLRPDISYLLPESFETVTIHLNIFSIVFRRFMLPLGAILVTLSSSLHDLLIDTSLETLFDALEEREVVAEFEYLRECWPIVLICLNNSAEAFLRDFSRSIVSAVGYMMLTSRCFTKIAKRRHLNKLTRHRFIAKEISRWKNAYAFQQAQAKSDSNTIVYLLEKDLLDRTVAWNEGDKLELLNLSFRAVPVVFRRDLVRQKI
ncbi:hypothetical protein F511_05772 [Dorcoceras hygrometricum]|uniref:Uncharacterized protein n=1 Tax=Dorcoceras hygrometricum TaxID=472368 RepID=A0A2Z7BIJ1_9LAMI|nr:hypothetical protein F511_05772 [Dorcoceras hygrometricum]